MADQPADDAHIEALRRVLELVRAGASAHELLGVPRTADKQATRAAWLKLARALHPDQAAFHRAGLRDEATKATQAINGAHREVTRPDYASRQAGGEEGGPSNGDRRGADLLYRRGLAAVNSGQWSEAERLLADGGEGPPPGLRDTRCEALLAWAIYNNRSREPRGRAAEARAALERIVLGGGERRGRAMAHHYLALIHRSAGEPRKAARQLDECLQLDPHHREAASLRRLLQQRAANGAARPVAGGAGKGLWRRLFGK